MRVVAAGGGTGGHLFPLLAILEEMNRRTEIEVLFFSVEGKIDDRLVRRDHPSYDVVPLEIRGLKRPLHSLENLSRIFEYLKVVGRIRRRVREFDPDLALLTGGYVSAVVGFALPKKIPIFVHEQNVVPGLANRYLMGRARKIFLSFEESLEFVPDEFRGKVEITGNPVRDLSFSKSILNVPDGLVLVLGGSLGSELINSTMEKVYEMDRESFYVHSTGDDSWTRRLSRFENVLASNFLDHMPLFWRKARFVIARAGASTVGEMMYHGVGGILVPWRGSAESHQMENAKAAAKRLDVEILSEEDVNPDLILERVRASVYRRRTPSKNPAVGIVESIMEEIP